MDIKTQEEPEMASDKLDIIMDWLLSVKRELKHERISYGELAEIDSVYDIIKED